MFKVIVQNSDASQKYDIPYSSFIFSEEINNDRSATVRFDNQTILQIGEKFGKNILEVLGDNQYRELYIYDGATLLYGGYIAEINPARGVGELGNLTLSSKGFFSLLEKRITNEVYSSEDLGDIAWDIIDTSQNEAYGSIGITRGLHPTTRDADRDYKYKNIALAIEKMSNKETKNGFDFEITNAKVFNIYYPAKDSYNPEIVLEDNHKILSYNFLIPVISGNSANQVIVFGDGFGANAKIETRDAEDSYKNALGLLQKTINEKDTKLTVSLQKKGDRYLAKNKYPQKTISVTLDYYDFDYSDVDLGDWVTIKIPLFGINRQFRIIRRSLDEKGNIRLTLDETL